MPGNLKVTPRIAAALLSCLLPFLAAGGPAWAGEPPPGADTLRPDAPSARPRIILNADIRDAAAEAGFPLPAEGPAVYPVLLDSGETFSVARPVAQGPDSLRILVPNPAGAIRAETLPRARVRAILDPGGRAVRPAETIGLLALALSLPLVFPTFNPLLAFPEFWSAAPAFFGAPRYQARSPDGFLSGPRPVGSLSLALAAAPRSLVVPGDPRFEPAGGVQAEFEGWMRRSPVSFSLVVRALRVSGPLRRAAPAFSAPAQTSYWGFRPGEYDSTYAEMGTALTFTPALRIVWADLPHLVLFSRFGTMLAGSRPPADGWVGGPEISFGCEAWPAAHWGLRAEAAWISSLWEDMETSDGPAGSLGLAYRFGPREAPSYQPPVAAAVFLAPVEAGGVGPSFQVRTGIGPFQDAGLETGFSASAHRSISSYPGSFGSPSSASETRTRARRSYLELAYSLHTAREGRAWIGMWAGLGLAAETRLEESRNVYGQDTSRSAGAGHDLSLAVSLGPEAGLRLLGPLGLRARWRIAGAEGVSGWDRYAFSAGLEYSVPGRGRRR